MYIYIYIDRILVQFGVDILLHKNFYHGVFDLRLKQIEILSGRPTLCCMVGISGFIDFNCYTHDVANYL